MCCIGRKETQNECANHSYYLRCNALKQDIEQECIQCYHTKAKKINGMQSTQRITDERQERRCKKANRPPLWPALQIVFYVYPKIGKGAANIDEIVVIFVKTEVARMGKSAQSIQLLPVMPVPSDCHDFRKIIPSIVFSLLNIPFDTA